MGKRGQHKNDAFDQTKSPGGNHPDRSQTITTGTYKKRETYARQAAEHSGKTSDRGETGDRLAQAAQNEWRADRLDRPRNEHRDLRARASDVSGGRSGSDSNAS